MKICNGNHRIFTNCIVYTLKWVHMYVIKCYIFRIQYTTGLFLIYRHLYREHLFEVKGDSHTSTRTTALFFFPHVALTYIYEICWYQSHGHRLTARSSGSLATSARPRGRPPFQRPLLRVSMIIPFKTMIKQSLKRITMPLYSIPKLVNCILLFFCTAKSLQSYIRTSTHAFTLLGHLFFCN